MQKHWWFFLGTMMAGAMLFASEPAIDLSGTWDLHATVTEDDVPYQTQLRFVLTPFTTQSGAALYIVDSKLSDWRVWGASIEQLDGHDHLVWWGTKNEGQEFDVESNIILTASDTAFSLGGDFETYEVATMVKSQP